MNTTLATVHSFDAAKRGLQIAGWKAFPLAISGQLCGCPLLAGSSHLLLVVADGALVD
jgi:hypothetical protein